jgi:kumamolisin
MLCEQGAPMGEIEGTEHVARPGYVPVDEPFLLPALRVAVKVRPAAGDDAFACADAMGHMLPLERAAWHHQHGGALDADMATVARYLQNSQFKIVEMSSRLRSIIAMATPAAVFNAFGATLRTFRRKPGDEYSSYENALRVSDALDGLITTVAGLDTRTVALRVRTETRPADQDPYPVDLLMRAYRAPPGDGRGQQITLMQLGGGFSRADTRRYFRRLGLKVPVKVFTVPGYPNNPKEGNTEPTTDVQIAGACAPRARIVCLFAPPTERGWIEGMTKAVFGAPPFRSVISLCWGWPEDAAGHGLSESVKNEICRLLAEAACRGTTVVVASGDYGALANSPAGHIHVLFPTSSPHALACGGTSLTLRGDDIIDESVWHTGSQSSGGGWSSMIPAPAWQRGIMTERGVPRDTWRGIPDVAAYADCARGVATRVDGCDIGQCGTSAATPLWAGMVARINEHLAKVNRRASVGYITPLLYETDLGKKPNFRDIVDGNNAAYHAHEGWDACTGWGTPNGRALLNSLLQKPLPPNQSPA